MIPSLPRVSHSLQSWKLLTTVATVFQSPLSQSCGTWASFGITTFSLAVDNSSNANILWHGPYICSWDFASLLWETIMYVRVSMGSEVCQIWPSSSAPAASADCGHQRLRETQLMTQGQRGWTHTKPALWSVWSARTRIVHVSQLAAVNKPQCHSGCARYFQTSQMWLLQEQRWIFHWKRWGQASQCIFVLDKINKTLQKLPISVQILYISIVIFAFECAVYWHCGPRMSRERELWPTPRWEKLREAKGRFL